MSKIKTLLQWLGSRLNERSSWLGLTAIIASLGITISPDLQDVIVQIGVSIGGLIAFLTTDKTTASAATATPTQITSSN